MTAKLIRIPQLGDVPYPVQMEPHLVVEFYSRWRPTSLEIAVVACAQAAHSLAFTLDISVIERPVSAQAARAPW